MLSLVIVDVAVQIVWMVMMIMMVTERKYSDCRCVMIKVAMIMIVIMKI